MLVASPLLIRPQTPWRGTSMSGQIHEMGNGRGRREPGQAVALAGQYGSGTGSWATSKAASLTSTVRGYTPKQLSPRSRTGNLIVQLQVWPAPRCASVTGTVDTGWLSGWELPLA